MPPAWLLWLLPVPLATVGAIFWASWTSRAKGPEQAIDTVVAFERFRDAMQQPVPTPRREAPARASVR